MNYKGKAYYLNKSSFDISQAKKITGLKRKTKNDVVKKKGIAGDVLKGADYCYIYSLPDDSKPENCYACVPAGTAVNIINANYNKNWMKVKYKDLYVAYMKKADVKTADAYLAGTGREYQPYIKLAKQLKLTYTGILKDYSKTIKKKDLCRLAVLWYQAMGNKLPKQKTTSPFKDTRVRLLRWNTTMTEVCASGTDTVSIWTLREERQLPVEHSPSKLNREAARRSLFLNSNGPSRKTAG